MSARKRASRSRSRREPILEALEGRELLSYAALFASSPLRFGRSGAPTTLPGAAVSTLTIPSTVPQTSAGHNARLLASFLPYARVLYPGAQQPTAHELAREAFVAKFNGTYQTGPGRFTNQGMMISFTASGGSNSSLHMYIQGNLVLPADPNNQTVVGSASLFPKNVLSSGAIGTLALQGNRDPNIAGLPTQLNWMVNINESSGLFLSPGTSAAGGGSFGSAQLRFIPERSQHGFSSGKVSIVLRGLIYNTGTLNTLGNPGNHPGPGALQPTPISGPFAP
jgi:hypothetical protein